ncbi:hypothetical protein PFLUOLIPICF7_08215 [Pseudomonas simiae]|uniref:Uncharacterized protein n=1 Tax=Pseudomonas simiae TaxID=321846 RepID=A0A1N7UAM6_9PSED|nr:hypothetical protein PS417_00030 [Pseudomonas simiae]AJZ97029.1 hypothetical protein PFLUOLIPICF7_08215 [Pseudomonas simiae]
MRRLILFLMVRSRYLSHIGIEDFQWVNRPLFPAYREIRGLDESAHNSSDSKTGRTAAALFK